MFKKSSLKSSRLVKRKRRILKFKIVSVLVGIIALIILFAWIMHRPALIVRAITVEGNSGVDTDGITAVAREDLGGSYMWLIPHTSKLFYPKQKIARDILAAFPRLDMVHVSQSNGTLTISVTERLAAYTWCTGTPGDVQSSCYFMDDRGYIFSAAPTFSGNAYFSFYGILDTSTTSPIGMHYLNSDEFKKVDTLVSVLKAHLLTSYALAADETGVENLYSGSSTRIIFTTADNASSLAANLETILTKTTVFENHATSSVDYIDLRFGDKIYYRYK